MIENGWEINIPLKRTAELSQKYYLCRCRHLMFKEEELESEDLIICPKCGNNLFLSLEAFQNPKQHLFAAYFNFSTRTYFDNIGWHAVISYYLPSYQEDTQVLTWMSKDVLRNSLRYDGLQQMNTLDKHVDEKAILKGLVASKFSSLFNKKVATSLKEYVFKTLTPELKWLSTIENNEKLKTDLNFAAFCLKYPAVKEVDLYYWNAKHIPELLSYPSVRDSLTFILNNRKEKSVRKALYLSYKKKMEQTARRYDPTFDYVILRVFSDANYLTFLLSIDAYNKNNMFHENYPETIIDVFTFLKEYYTEKQLFSFIKQSVTGYNHYHLWQDSLRMLSNQGTLSVFREHFNRSKPQVTLLHDELVRIQNFYINPSKIDMLSVFSYSKQKLKAQATFMELEFKLPSTAKDLHTWGTELNNCMFSYSSSIRKQRTTIYGVFKEQKLVYAVEIKNNKIIQTKAVSNQSVATSEKSIITQWYNNYF